MVATAMLCPNVGKSFSGFFIFSLQLTHRNCFRAAVPFGGRASKYVAGWERPCKDGRLARQARQSLADADAACVRALTGYKQFLNRGSNSAFFRISPAQQPFRLNRFESGL